MSEPKSRPSPTVSAVTGDRIVAGDLPAMMLPQEVAKYLRVTKDTIMRELSREADLEAAGRPRQFPNAFKLAGRWRIPREDAIAYAQSLYGRIERSE